MIRSNLLRFAIGAVSSNRAPGDEGGEICTGKGETKMDNAGGS